MSSTRFAVDSDLLLELGEGLVANKSTALAELVKNSYDADATDVRIELENIAKTGGTITIKDNGHGMDFETVEKAWMRVATNEKKRKPRSEKYERVLTGSKGVGRFACRVLSNVMILDTVGVRTGTKEKERTTVSIDWKSFHSGADISAVSVPYERSEVPMSTSTGTLIILKDTRGVWTQKDVEDMRDRLLSLVSPFPRTETEVSKKEADPGLTIFLNAPEFNVAGPIGPEEFLQYGFGRLKGRLSREGVPSYDFSVRMTKETCHYAPEKRFSNLGSCDFVIDFFVYSGEYFEDIPISVVDARDRGREKGGVRVYLDRFRILPYGESGDDWLSLDEDRGRRLTRFRFLREDTSGQVRPALLKPGNNQVFGVANLSRIENPNIALSITREKLLENQAFRELREFLQTGIEWMTVQYARLRAQIKRKPKRDPIKTLSTAKNSLKKVENLDAQVYSQVIQFIDMAIEAVRESEEEHISEASMLRVLASTGTMITVFQHEISEMIGEVIQVSESLKRISRGLPRNELSEMTRQIAKLDAWVGMARTYARQIGILVGEESRDARRSIGLYYIISNMEDAFKKYFNEYAIKFINDVKKNTFLPRMYNCEAYAVLLNILTNAIKAVKKRDQRIIKVEGESENGRVVVRVLDTGPGIPKERREELFKPFVSDSEPDPIFGQGTGLGLTIVKNIVETYNGTVGFLDPPENWSTCIEIVFREETDNE